MSTELPPCNRTDWEAAIGLLRSEGGVIGALVTCDNRLRDQIRELRELVLGLEARISDLDNHFLGLHRDLRAEHIAPGPLCLPSGGPLQVLPAVTATVLTHLDRGTIVNGLARVTRPGLPDRTWYVVEWAGFTGYIESALVAPL